MAILTPVDFANAKRDINDIGKSVNEDAIVQPRWGGAYDSLPRISRLWLERFDLLASNAESMVQDWQDAINLITVEGGIPALAISDASGINQQELNNKTITTVESIANLIAIQNPKDGQVVYAKSYNTGQGEGGDDFIYKSTRQLENNGISIFNGWERQKNGNAWTPEDAGAVHTLLMDDSPAFNLLFSLAKTKPINIEYKADAEYLISKDVIVYDLLGLNINANNALIRFDRDGLSYGVHPMYLVFKEGVNSFLVVKNIRQDGSLFYYDPTTAVGTERIEAMGVNVVNAKTIIIDTIHQEKIIGYGLKFYNYTNLTVRNYTTVDVGGNNASWSADSLGDAIYLGRRRGHTKAIFENIDCPAPRFGENNTPSRIFLTVENLDRDNYKDETTEIILKNVTTKNYMRGVHVEINAGEVIITGDNVHMEADVCFLSTVTPRTSVVLTNSYIKPDNKGYAGTNTLNWGCDVYMGAGCVLDGIKQPAALLSQNSSNATSFGCGAKVINVCGRLAVNGLANFFSGSSIEFLESFDDYYMFNSTIICSGATLRNANSTTIKTMSRNQNDFILNNCEVVNLDFDRKNYVQNTSTIKMNTSLTGYAKKLIEARNADIYLDGVLYHKHNEQNEVTAGSSYVSANDLTLEGNYYIESKPLTDVPVGFTAGLIETKLAAYIPNLTAHTLIQSATNFTTLVVNRRTRNYQGVWSAWV